MPFNSIQFLLFLTTVVAVNFALPLKWRWLWLLAASYAYYVSWQPVAALVLAGVTAVVFVSARVMAGSTSPGTRRAVLIGTLILAAMPLVVFKYANFFNDSVLSLIGKSRTSTLHLILPIGISFFTFKALSYVIDVYQRKISPEHHAGKLALYVSFFPQILAGPIERSTRFLPQLERAGSFDRQRVIDGIKRIAWGLFTKLVIADQLAILVNRVYDNPVDQSASSLIVATYLFSFQILCDFAGYSDMAIGVAKILGFDTMENFQRPYFAKSISEFWRRWHITLSSWFRDYLYIPMGGSRIAVWRWGVNVLIVFLVSGLWHGASLTFVVWGGLHGLYLIVDRLTSGIRNRLWSVFGISADGWMRKGLAIFVTFHLATFAWIFFRASCLSQALVVVKGMATPGSCAFTTMELMWSAGCILLILASHLMQARGNAISQLSRWPIVLRWTVYAAIVLAIVNLQPEYKPPFMYMQY